MQISDENKIFDVKIILYTLIDEITAHRIDNLESGVKFSYHFLSLYEFRY